MNPLRDRVVAAGGLAIMVVLAWRFLWVEARAMESMAMPELRFADALAPAFVMWAVMMVGMMLPSAAPAMFFYGTLVRNNTERGCIRPDAWIYVEGYIH